METDSFSAERAILETLFRPTLNSTLLKLIMNPLTTGQISAPLNYCLQTLPPGLCNTNKVLIYKLKVAGWVTFLQI